MRFFITSLIALLLFFSFISCNKKDIDLPQTENETLNELISSAPATIISLAESPIDTLYADEENRFGDESDSSFSPSAFLGTVMGMVKSGDHLYVADRKQNCIWVLDKKGKIVRKVGRKGKGPGEFENLTGIFKNETYIFTTDMGNGRFLIYDHNLDLKDVYDRLVTTGTLTGNKAVSANKSFLYLPTHYQDTMIVEAHRTNAPFDLVDKFLPILIPLNKQPRAYNNYIIDTNEEGNIAIAYNGLPYIFLFDDSHELQHVIYLKLPEDQMPDNQSPKPVVNNSREGVGITRLISKIMLMDDGTLYFFIGGNLYELVPKEHSLQDMRYFTYDENVRPEWNEYGIRVSNMYIEDNTIYLGSGWEEYIYRFQLN